MKHLYIITALLLNASVVFADRHQKEDTVKASKSDGSKIFTAIDVIPEFPGGTPEFSKFIEKNLKYPEVASLTGLNGKVFISFVVETDGAVSSATPIRCLGAGCESEAIRIVSMSPKWTPGSQNGKPVRVSYVIPISFNANRSIVYLRDLRRSNYGFIFSIKDKLYTLDEAEKIVGKSYLPNQLQEADPFYNADKNQKFEMPDKKEVYLLKLIVQD